ncbi:dethiobiotin synthase [Tepidicaulis marinus]|jgi:dethiobiotin synthetase|uniref:ATP-dependent dethiobiotin synthetase BioD n=1 Tax=Tepidicaulis marinus TaxID=1333998 RepID=A0A081B759_9HYPH|nr:dethiobiotin synthase [Tepidicaulis marinus]GAK43877.1 dethiobiotin synthase [Tepidicaulis marinus]
MSVFFVTSSGTEIGKTFVSSHIVRQLKARGDKVLALKPVLSGITPETVAGSDTALLLEAMGREVTDENFEAITPWHFKEAMSPDMAAAREGRSVPFRSLVSFCGEAARANHDHLLIEGVGGLMVPLDETHLVLDWMKALTRETALTPILVVGSYLGTVSHTLTALKVMKEEGLAPGAIIVSQSEEAPVPLEETCAVIGRFAGGVPIVPLPRLARGEEAPDLLFWH